MNKYAAILILLLAGCSGTKTLGVGPLERRVDVRGYDFREYAEEDVEGGGEMRSLSVESPVLTDTPEDGPGGQSPVL